LDFGDVAEGWVQWAFGDGGEDLVGWVMEGWMVLGGGLRWAFIWVEALVGGYSWTSGMSLRAGCSGPSVMVERTWLGG
jgi:hypothetical protein